MNKVITVILAIVIWVSICLLLFMLVMDGEKSAAIEGNFKANCEIHNGKIITTYIETGASAGTRDKKFCLLENKTRIQFAPQGESEQ